MNFDPGTPSPILPDDDSFVFFPVRELSKFGNLSKLIGLMKPGVLVRAHFPADFPADFLVQDFPFNFEDTGGTKSTVDEEKATDGDIVAYTEDRNCGKCGATQLTLKYCKGGSSASASLKPNCTQTTVEHLHLTCQVCGYLWLTRTKSHP